MKKETTKIHRYIELSTAHITEKTAHELQKDGCKYKNIFAREYEYGYYIYIQKNILAENPPDDLKAIIKYAKKHKADLIILDRDCDTVNELKTYEW